MPYLFSCFRRQRQLSLSACAVVFRHYADNNPELNCNRGLQFLCLKAIFPWFTLPKLNVSQAKRLSSKLCIWKESFWKSFFFYNLQSHYNNDNHNNKIQKGGKKGKQTRKKKLVPTCKIYATKLIIQLTIQRRMTYLHNITYISFLIIILPTNLTLQCVDLLFL